MLKKMEQDNKQAQYLINLKYEFNLNLLICFQFTLTCTSTFFRKCHHRPKLIPPLCSEQSELRIAAAADHSCSSCFKVAQCGDARFTVGRLRLFQSTHNPVTIENRVHININFFIIKTQEIISCSNVHKLCITLYIRNKFMSLKLTQGAVYIFVRKYLYFRSNLTTYTFGNCRTVSLEDAGNNLCFSQLIGS